MNSFSVLLLLLDLRHSHSLRNVIYLMILRGLKVMFVLRIICIHVNIKKKSIMANTDTFILDK